MPSLSILEQIAVAIQARIAAIREGTVYTFTPAGGPNDAPICVRPTRLGLGLDGYDPRDKRIALEQNGEGEIVAYYEGNPATIHWRQPFDVHIFCITSDDSTQPVDTLLNERRADIEIALLTDRTFGGLAHATTNLGPAIYWPSVAGEFTGVTVSLLVEYETKETDPRVNAIGS